MHALVRNASCRNFHPGTRLFLHWCVIAPETPELMRPTFSSSLFHSPRSRQFQCSSDRRRIFHPSSFCPLRLPLFQTRTSLLSLPPTESILFAYLRFWSSLISCRLSTSNRPSALRSRPTTTANTHNHQIDEFRPSESQCCPSPSSPLPCWPWPTSPSLNLLTANPAAFSTP